MERVPGSVSSWVRLHPSKTTNRQQIELTSPNLTPHPAASDGETEVVLPSSSFSKVLFALLRLSFPGFWLLSPLELVLCHGTHDSNEHLLEKVGLLPGFFSLSGCFAVLFPSRHRIKGSAYPQTRDLRGRFETNVGSEMGRGNSTCRASFSVNSNNTPQFTNIAGTQLCSSFTL